MRIKKSPVLGKTYNISDIYQDYTNNELAANKKYKDKYIRVQTKIDKIQEDIFNNAFLTTNITDTFDSAAFYMKNITDKVLSLKTGNTVDLMCKGDGTTFNNLIFQECVFTKDYLDLFFNKAIQNITLSTSESYKPSSKIEFLISGLVKSVLEKCNKSPSLCDNKKIKDYPIPNGNDLEKILNKHNKDFFQSLPSFPD